MTLSVAPAARFMRTVTVAPVVSFFQIDISRSSQALPPSGACPAAGPHADPFSVTGMRDWRRFNAPLDPRSIGGSSVRKRPGIATRQPGLHAPH